MEITMSCKDSGPAWCHSFAEDGEVTIVGDGGAQGFFEMFGDRPSTDDLFELVWQGSGPGSGSSMEMETSLVPSSSPAVTLPPQTTTLEPPSENEMATWLYPIFRGKENVDGQDLPCGNCVNDQIAAPAKESSEKLPSTEGRCSSQETPCKSSERTKTATGARRSHHPETHNLTEKRRRQKINEKLKTLQQLVPGCDKSNQVSTLDQTIQYMKSLQQYIQAMSCGCGMKPASGTVYPVVQPPYLPPTPPSVPLTSAPGTMLARGHARPGVVLGSPPAIVLVSPMLPFVHHPAVMMLPYPNPNVAPRPDRESRRKGNLTKHT